jgi:hypothetical protein
MPYYYVSGAHNYHRTINRYYTLIHAILIVQTVYIVTTTI